MIIYKECKIGIFSWHYDVIEEGMDWTKLSENNITEVYQLFSRKVDRSDVLSFCNNAADNEINVYSLSGEVEWAFEEDGKSLIEEINEVKALNTDLPDECKIKGLVFDVEPHSLDEWKSDKEDIMSSYLSGLKNAYKYKEDLLIYICIPYYYDTMGLESFLAEAIDEGCDGFMIMNYSVGNEIENMEYETALCKERGKRIFNIYEFNKPGTHGLVQKNTFYGRSKEELDENMKNISDYFLYYNLSFAFHDYRSWLQ